MARILKADLIAKVEALGYTVTSKATVATLEEILANHVEPVEVPAEPVKDEWRTVPNRRDLRAHRRSQGRRNDGAPRGGFVRGPERADSFKLSVIAGQQGKAYGNVKGAKALAFGPPRDVAVNVIDTQF